MKNAVSENPIGIFDSGVGGLTVMHALTTLLPNEHMIYFGDTAHHPYGEKSAEAIQQYVLKISEWLQSQHCKLLLIACNSASAAAYEILEKKFGATLFIINMIDPVVNFIQQHCRTQKIGLIGTKQTVNSGVYQQKLTAHDIQCITKATPLLAPIIEEGLGQSDIIDPILSHYLNTPELKNITTLILACTHYPIIRDHIIRFYNHQVNVIDPGKIISTAVKTLLQQHNLENKIVTQPERSFYISDRSEAFLTTAKTFFPDPIYLHHYPLWENI